MARAHGSRLNPLGIVSILLALAALVATRFAIAGYGPTPIALVSIGVGVLGFLISILAGRWGSGTPVIGIVLSIAAIGWVRYSDGTLPAWWARIHPAPHALPPVAGLASPAPSDPATDATPREHNIFTDPGSSTNSGAPAHVAPRLTPLTPAPPDVPSIPASPAVPATMSLAEARAKLDAATAAVEKSLSASAEYQSAKAAIADADAKRKAAVAASGAGSEEVLSAGNEWLSAKARLKKIVDAAAEKDSAVQTAQRDLKDAEAAARAAKLPSH